MFSKKYILAINLSLLFLFLPYYTMAGDNDRLKLKAFEELFFKNASFVGSKSCYPCHQEEYRQWEKSRHSKAFLSLTSRGKEDESKCVICHVIGFGSESGFKNIKETPTLINVQCESCHGPGSLHIVGKEVKEFSEEICAECHDISSNKKKGLQCDECHPEFAKHINKIQKSKSILKTPSKEVCIECHDEKNDRKFNFSTKLKSIYHIPVFAQIDEELKKERKDVVLLKSAPEAKVSSYVGDKACRDCHKNEYNSWSKTGHAKSFETLKKTNEQTTVRCLRCHTTGYGKASGFIDEDNTPYLKEVGCESCHGPGRDHVDASPDKKLSSLTGITKDCPTCSIPRTCKRCHTIRQDTDFNIDKDLELIKHYDLPPE